MNKRLTFLACLALLTASQRLLADVTVKKLNPTMIEITRDGQQLTLDFYGPDIVRLFCDPKGGIVRNPEAQPPAQILTDRPREEVGALTITPPDNTSTHTYRIATSHIVLAYDGKTGSFSIANNEAGHVVTTATPSFNEKGFATLTLSATANEGFYGGGVQNGRFAHRGQVIAIENTNSWTDGGVASPTPFYWSTAGYGILWHTFRPGRYDFGATEGGVVKLMHEEPYLDLFIMVDDGCVALLNDFYQLTGHPVLLPKFGFYEGHLNAYNRDYWKRVETAPTPTAEGSMTGTDGSIRFEDGHYYKESQKPVDDGVRESLNGELRSTIGGQEVSNYPFSARAVVDRYEAADMPLGWVLPNDGYGAGYGQTPTLEGNVENLRQFGDYARSKGVEIGLWTQSDLHPKEGVEALLQRDIVREVRDAGVRVLKTDVAWVGAGYSFGLNGVADVGEIMPYYGDDARPFIISLDGWAGTQRYAGIWTGDQTGGEWEYIRFHIPTYIGAGLSGQPNICSDMDGIFGGRNIPVNVRDFQWKTFSPMQLNMDGWGANPKYPQALGTKAADINRQYLKMKAMLMPYTYTIAHEAIDGKPMIRAMFLEEPNAYTMGTATRYQFMYGPSILVAPIYQDTKMDAEGNDIRNGIYLPEGEWMDWNTASIYKGGRIINNYDTPLDRLPVFVKRGAIIPMTDPHNNPNQMKTGERAYWIVPGGASAFTEYDDDGRTEAYKRGAYATTHITQELNDKGQLTVVIEPTKGGFDAMTKVKDTYLYIYAQGEAKSIKATANGKRVTVGGIELLGEHANKRIKLCIPQADVAQRLVITLTGIALDTTEPFKKTTGALATPKAVITDDNTKAYTITPTWETVGNADFYEIDFNGMLYSTIKDTQLLFEDLTPVTDYTFKVRAVNADGVSDWAMVSAQTKPDPLRHAIRDIRAETTCENQGGQGINKLFDFDESKGWHTKWGQSALPFDIIVDLRTVNVLDKLQYMPRPDAGNGTLLRGTIAWSMDKTNWHEETAMNWARNGEVKEFVFASHPTARYIKMHIDEAVGNFGSGQEMYIFRVEGSDYYIPGDVNHDGRIDENDLTSYMNYTGLRAVDPDFQGYMSQGDLNGNLLIDAYDISAVGIELESGVSSRRVEPVAGSVSINADKKNVEAGEMVTITVTGSGLRSVNAFSCALPYDAAVWEYIGMEAPGMKEMRSLTYDRLHANGQKALYPTFVNCGEQPYVEGDGLLMNIRFRAKQRTRVKFTAQDGMLVDKYLNVVTF